MTLGMILGAGIMAGIAAFFLFKLKELDSQEQDGAKLATSLQALFFFIIIANFILIGSAGYESRNDCSYLLMNETIAADTTFNNYEYVCTERLPNSSIWLYKLPLWLAGFSGLYVLVWVLIVVFRLLKMLLGGGKRG